MTCDPGLFDPDPFYVAGPEPEGWAEMSAGQRLTHRQKVAIELGQHPLSVVLHTPMALHPEAATEPNGPGRRCGNCVFRVVYGYHDRSYGKCQFGDGARISHGVGTDVRRWWPACRDHQPPTEEFRQ